MTNEPHVTAMDLDLVDLGQPQARARLDAHAAVCPDCAARRAEHEKRALHFRTVVFPRTAGQLTSRSWRRPGWR